MVRHMVLFRFRAEATNQERKLVLDGLANFPSLFPTMKRFGLGENISQRDQTFTHVMTAEFDNRKQLDIYLCSSIHEKFITDYFRPNIEQRAIVSYKCASA